ncbi:glycosyltransferase [Cyanobium sp. FGCU-52]|nr:glycosyltransferase [Cyanobium sp. FGCU52]
MADPLVSVVMGVRNGGSALEPAVRSVLDQANVDLELVVVDDGSDDGSDAVLAALAAQDGRLRVLRRKGRGLTAALIEGCEEARGLFLARQDAGDLSLPGRLQRQLACLEADPSAVLCSTHSSLVVPEGTAIAINAPQESDLADGLSMTPQHGCVLMRREAYRHAGGYRRCFYYAQDLDLWSRLVEIGRHRVILEVLYEARIDPGSISGMRRREQDAFHRLIVRAAQARREGRSEAPWLDQAEALSERCRRGLPRSARRKAAGAYFLGASLSEQEPALARRYLQQAVALDPLHWRARWKLARLR